MAEGKKKPDPLQGEHSLRNNAEQQIARVPKGSADFKGQSPEQLIHELQVHQIELETQAEELMRAQLALKESRDKFLDLYDFAPTGYFTLTDKALIAEVNLSGATLLGVERGKLINTRFRKFIAPEFLEQWDLYLVNLLKQDEKQTCILTLKRGDGSTVPARLEGIRLTGSDGVITAHIAISDITDIWQIAALRESEGLLKTVVTNLHGVVFAIDKEGIFLISEGKSLSSLGLQHGQVVGQSVFDVYSNVPEIIAGMKTALSGEPWSGISHVQDVFFDTFVTPVFDSSQSVSGAVGIAIDITDRKRVEDALHESAQYTRSLIDVSLDPLVTISHEGRIIDVNAATERVTGYPRDHLIGTDFSDYFRDTEQAKKGYQKVFADGIVRDYPLEIKNRDGTIRDVIYNAAVYRDGSGTVKGVFASAHDITDKKVIQDALKASELQYRRLFETAQDGILILDEETGTIIDANTFLIDMLGYPLEYFVGKHLWEVGFIKDKSLAQNAFTELKTKGYIRYEDLPLETIDGRSIDVEFISNVYAVNHHKIIQCNIRDITARKYTENALALASKKLTLLSGITRHDINNQLMTVNGFLGILQRKVPDPTLEDYFTKITKTSERITAMIKFTKEYENIGVNSPVWKDCRTLIDTATKQAPLGKVMVKNDLPPGTEVFADPLIVKVFYNLMDNAARYGGKITTIRFSVDERDGDQIIVCEDDGDGVVAEEKERIFDRGFGKNTGLGLALAREILDITGITIRETGVPGKGARFEMIVPKGKYRITNVQMEKV